MYKLFASFALLCALSLAAQHAQAHGNHFAQTIPAPAGSIICDEDGHSGSRIQSLYVHTIDVTSTYTANVDTITKAIAGIDGIYATSSGGQRHVRFTTDPTSSTDVNGHAATGCEPSILAVTVPVTATDELDYLIDALQAQGYDNPDRKYLLFVDDNQECGTANPQHDSTPGPNNRSNHTAGYAWIGRDCWQAKAAAHELTHLLGAVQYDAPHTTHGWHCTDEHDLMCYSDLPHQPPMTYPCADESYEYRLDCNGDDYFNLDPEPGNYLADHWNVANSAFLIQLNHSLWLPIIKEN